MAAEDQRIRTFPADGVFARRVGVEERMDARRVDVANTDRRQELEKAVAAGDAPQRHAAYLPDRVAMNEGRPQIYGTQIGDVEDGEGIPWPIRDPERLDERRASVGLEPFAEYVAQWRGMT